MTKPDKYRIQQSFGRAASTYDSATPAQRRICDHLLQNLPVEAAFSQVLDAGCGTGYGLQQLQEKFPTARFVALDLSPDMLAICPTDNNTLKITGDLESLPLLQTSIDLYWSSLAVQWCHLPSALHEAHRILKPGGQLALATLGPKTFHELRHAFSAVDEHQHTLGFHTEAEVKDIAEAKGFTDLRLETWCEQVFYPDFKSLLMGVKASGANQLGAGRRQTLLSKEGFKQAESRYETFRTERGLPLSYHVIALYSQA